MIDGETFIENFVSTRSQGACDVICCEAIVENFFPANTLLALVVDAGLP